MINCYSPFSPSVVTRELLDDCVISAESFRGMMTAPRPTQKRRTMFHARATRRHRRGTTSLGFPRRPRRWMDSYGMFWRRPRGRWFEQ